MHDVGAGVRLPGAEPPLRVDLGQHLRPLGEFAVGDPDPVHDQLLVDLLHVQHLGRDAVAQDQPGVGVLAAGLGVEGGAVQHQLDLVTRLRRVDPGPVPDQTRGRCPRTPVRSSR